MDAKRVVSILEKVQFKLGAEAKGSTGAANLPKASTHTSSTAEAKKRLKELEALNKKSRTSATKVDAKRGYPSSSTRR